MIRTDPAWLKTPDADTLRQGPELAVLSALDATLVATHPALDARHPASHVACWHPNVREDVQLAAAIIAAGLAMRRLVAEYGALTHAHIVNELPLPF